MENLTDDLRRIMGLKDSSGVLINGILPRSTAAAADFRKGDILLRINDHSFRDIQDAVHFVGSQQSNTSFSYELLRDKKKISGKAAFRPFPEEQYEDLQMVYTAAKTGSGMQRIIVSKGKETRRYPLVVFLGGIGCYSLDMPFDSSRSEVQLLNRLTRAGFMTARIEKPGMGDNAGKSRACSEISFTEEAEGYINAIESLKKRSDVDAENVFIIGHSMGGLFAPIVAAKTHIKGIVAYGTIGSNFIEYLAKTRQTIGEAYAWPPDETDAYIKDFCECAFYYFNERRSTAEVTAKKAGCSEYLGIFDLRSRAYNDELYAMNIPAVWKAYNGKALLLWGSSDYISSEEDHKILEATVNHYHSGNGKFITIRNADHGMNSAASFAEARTNPGRYNTEVGKTILQWLQQQAS